AGRRTLDGKAAGRPLRQRRPDGRRAAPAAVGAQRRCHARAGRPAQQREVSADGAGRSIVAPTHAGRTTIAPAGSARIIVAPVDSARDIVAPAASTRTIVAPIDSARGIIAPARLARNIAAPPRLSHRSRRAEGRGRQVQSLCRADRPGHAAHGGQSQPFSRGAVRGTRPVGQRRSRTRTLPPRGRGHPAAASAADDGRHDIATQHPGQHPPARRGAGARAGGVDGVRGADRPRPRAAGRQRRDRRSDVAGARPAHRIARRTCGLSAEAAEVEAGVTPAASTVCGCIVEETTSRLLHNFSVTSHISISDARAFALVWPKCSTTMACLSRPIVTQRYIYILTAYDPATRRTIRLATPNLRSARTKGSFLRESGYVEIDVKRVEEGSPVPVKLPSREQGGL